MLVPYYLMTVSDVCQFLKVDRKTLYVLRFSDLFPKPLKLSERSLRWRSDEVLTWLERDRAAY